MKKRFFVFWAAAIFLIVLRITFDLNAYFFGTALSYHGVSQSGYDYLLYLPKGYTDFAGKRPLLLYLHGAGETNIRLHELKQKDLVHWAKDSVDSRDFPFIVVCPVTPKHGWEPKRVVKLLDELLHDKGKRWQLDESRVYLTGMSMGGFGTFHTACEYPERFAAIVPVAGGGEAENAAALMNVPVWAFHGDADDVVPYECSAKMIQKMNEINCREAKLTTLHGAGHGIWKEVFSRSDVYQWLLKHKK